MEVEDHVPASQIMVGNSVFAFVGGTIGADKKKAVSNIWGRRGEVQILDIDLMGARPIN
jgi:hypothetical protein